MAAHLFGEIVVKVKTHEKKKIKIKNTGDLD